MIDGGKIIRRIYNLSPDLLCAAGFDGFLREMNPAWTEVLGWTTEELTSRPYIEFVHPEDQTATAAEAERLAQVGRSFGFRNRCRCRDGGYRQLSWNLVLDVELEVIVGIARDVTAEQAETDHLLRRCQEERLVAQEVLARVLAGIHDVAYAVVFDDDPMTGRLEYVSDAIGRCLGWSPEEFLDDPALWGRILHPDDLPFVIDATRRLQDEPHGTRTYRMRHKGSDEYLWFEDRVTAERDASGRVTRIFGVARNATAERAMEEALRRTQEELVQAQKMEAVGHLAGGVAHDFNNMLTAILGYSSFMEENLRARNDPMLADVQEIRMAGERAAALTRRLLAFGRRQVLQPQVMSLNDAVTGIARMLRRLIPENIEIRHVLASDLGLTMLDPSQVEQILLNLAVNSRDAMPGGGKLTIETANVELDAAYAGSHPDVTPGRWVLLAVTDDGIGMDRATQTRIFEPFFTTKERGVGTGLGLSTVHGIVKQSGGHIRVYSEPGKGASFKVYFPRVEGARDKAGPASGEAGAPLQGTETVLVVEDEEMVRRLAVSLLSGAGYTVLEAPRADHALEVEAAHDTPIHLVLTDLIMPGASGRDLVDTLTARRPDLKAVYMSGYAEAGIVHGGVLDAGLAFLPKPFTRETLLRKVRATLDG